MPVIRTQKQSELENCVKPKLRYLIMIINEMSTCVEKKVTLRLYWELVWECQCRNTAMGHPAWLDNVQTTDWVCWRLGESREVKESSLSNQFGQWYSSPVSGLDRLPSADAHCFQSVTRAYWKTLFEQLNRKNCFIQRHCLSE